MEQSKLDRINELSRKSKAKGLTPEEKLEQDTLRKEYVKAFRESMRGILDNTVIKRPDGTCENVKDRRRDK